MCFHLWVRLICQLFVVCIFSLVVLTVDATPPPNDNFADRIILPGVSLTFTGTLAGATLENNGQELKGWPGIGGVWIKKSVWWEWTASNSTVVTLQVIASSPGIAGFRDYQYQDGLAVYTNQCQSFPSNVCRAAALGGITFLPEDPRPCFSFAIPGGTICQILLAGSSDSTYVINLTTTNNPLIIGQPKSRTATINDTVLFTVMATGIRPLSYQWVFGGALLPGETYPIFHLDGVTTNNAGDYFVIVSNMTGVVTSKVANLVVNETESRPLLVANGIWPTNLFSFMFNGEAGRSYRIETSPDFINWSPATNFSAGVYSSRHKNLTSVVSSSGTERPLALSANGNRGFLRTLSYVPANAICNGNLKQITFAKSLWAWEHRLVSGDSPVDVDIFGIYLRRKPVCPQSGLYVTGWVDTLPSCSIINHVLEEPSLFVPDQVEFP